MSVEDYKFRRIADAMVCINQAVNLIGVVVETSVPKRSKGTDCFCTVKIIDESKPSGIHINFFAKNMESLPQVENVGDILLVSHVVVKSRVPEPYAMFNKALSSFALFRGRGESSNTNTYQIFSTYKPRNYDTPIMRLRNWSIQRNVSVPDESLLLREIKEATNLNLLCKILYISNAKGNEAILFVWDGTDTPPASLKAKLEDEMQSPLPLQFEPSLSRDILCTFPTVGTILRISVEKCNEYLKPERWVRLTHVKCEVRAALWVAVLMPNSKICYLHDDDDAVTGRLRSYNERLLCKWKGMPLSCFPWPSDLTETSEPEMGFVTLMDVLTHREVLATFKCVVRVVAIIPWMAKDFRSPIGTYRVRVTLEDPTARIHAYIYKDQGETFFGNSYSVDMLTKKRNLLLGVATNGGTPQAENVTRNPPWIQCCLRSYYLHETDVWGTRKFQIFDTKCLG